MKRLVRLLVVLLPFSTQALSGETLKLVLDINVFQGYRSNFPLREPSPPSIVVLPPDPGWSDDIERQREQIAATLGFDGVAVVGRERVEVAEGVAHVFDAGKDWRFPYQVAVRAERMGGDRAELDIRIVQRNSETKDVASASISGGLGKTVILAGNPPGNPLFVAVTPRLPTAVTRESGVKTVGGEVSSPKLLNQVAPAYPDKVRKEKVIGQVVIQAVIEKDGTVARASVVRPVHPDLDASALEAVRQWRYEPARLNGKPVAVYMTITVAFRLD
jgi:TonB family protein